MSQELKRKNKIKQVLKFIFLVLLFWGIAIFLGNLINDKFKDIRLHNSSIIKHPLLLNYLFVCIVNPVFEELIFRIGLRFNRLNFKAFVYSTLFYLVFYSEFRNYFLVASNHIYLKIAFFLVILILTKLFLKKRNIWLYINDVMNKNKKFIVWISIFAFTLWHIGLYDFSRISFLSSLIILSPYFIAGVFFTYLRLVYNFSLSLIIHILSNILPVVSTCIILHITLNDMLRGLSLQDILAR